MCHGRRAREGVIERKGDGGAREEKGSRGVEAGASGRERGGGIERWGSGSLAARVRRGSTRPNEVGWLHLSLSKLLAKKGEEKKG